MSDRAPNTRRYNMFPQKSFGGHVEAEIMTDGQIKYTLFPFPFDGSDTRTMIIDPAHAEDMRAVRQLHLEPILKEEPSASVVIVKVDSDSSDSGKS